jgi:hypothetical protein
MKIKLVSSAVIITAAAALLTFSACKKDQTPASALTTSTSTPSDNSMLMSESNNVDAMIMPAATNIMTFGKRIPFPLGWRIGRNFDISQLGPCATISFDTVGGARSMIINYGTSGCECWDGKMRSGEILLTWNGRYIDSGSVFSVVTVNYWINSNKLDIHKTVTNNGVDSSGDPSFSIVDSDTLTLDTTNQIVTLNSNRLRTWTAGFNTLNPFDDTYSITGSGSGTDRNGNAFGFAITNPLIFKMDCPWIESGTIDFTTPAFSQLSLDYGNGTCDNIATLDENGTDYTIHLRW